MFRTRLNILVLLKIECNQCFKVQLHKVSKKKASLIRSQFIIWKLSGDRHTDIQLFKGYHIKITLITFLGQQKGKRKAFPSLWFSSKMT